MAYAASDDDTQSTAEPYLEPIDHARPRMMKLRLTRAAFIRVAMEDYVDLRSSIDWWKCLWHDARRHGVAISPDPDDELGEHDASWVMTALWSWPRDNQLYGGTSRGAAAGDRDHSSAIASGAAGGASSSSIDSSLVAKSPPPRPGCGPPVRAQADLLLHLASPPTARIPQNSPKPPPLSHRNPPGAWAAPEPIVPPPPASELPFKAPPAPRSPPADPPTRSAGSPAQSSSDPDAAAQWRAIGWRDYSYLKG